MPRCGARHVVAVRRPKGHDVSVRWQHVLWTASLLVVAAAVCWYSVLTGNHYVDSPHNGFFLKNAVDLLEGRVMFRESFNSYGMLSTLIHAAGIKIWGWHILSLLNVTLVFVVALGLAIYCLWSTVMPPWAAFLAAFLYFLYNYRIHLPWPNYYATFFAVCAGLLLVAWQRSQQRSVWLLIAAGIVTGMAGLARQTLALPLLVMAGFFVAAVPSRRPHGLRALTAFLVGFAVALLPFFVYLLIGSAFTDWWIQSVRLIPLWYAPFAHTGGLGSQISYLATVLLDDLPLLTLTGIGASVGVCLLLALRRLPPEDESLALMAAISLAILSQVYPNEGTWRRTLALSAAFGWPIWLCYRAAGSKIFDGLRRRRLVRSAAFAPVCAVAVFLLAAVPKALAIYGEARVTFDLEAHRDLYFRHMTRPEVLADMWLPIAQAQFYAELDYEIADFRSQYPDAPVITTNGDVLPLLFVRRNDGFSPVFTVYPSIAWANIARNPAIGQEPGEIEGALSKGRQNREFESDTANVLAYPDYWARYASFVRARKPLIINAGETVEHYVPVRTVVFHDPSPAVVESQYYFWWSQFSSQPQSVVWRPQS